jgi:guanylate cyclase
VSSGHFAIADTVQINILIYTNSILALWGLDASNKPTVFGVAYSNINDVGAIFTPNYETEADSIWAIRGGKRPLSTPICGFDGICPPSVLFVTLVSIGSVALFISIIIFLLILVFICKHQERKRMNALWQIPFSKLVKQEQTVDFQELYLIFYF